MPSPPPPSSSPPPSTIDLLALASTTLTSAILASHPIVELTHPSHHSSLSPKTKTDGTLVTKADAIAQRIICHTIQDTFPTVRTVGEESEEDIINSCRSTTTSGGEKVPPPSPPPPVQATTSVSPGTKRKYKEFQSSEREEEDLQERLTKELTSRLVTTANVSKSPRHVDPSRVKVMIDPLDGTSAYAKGNYTVVTILIAILVDHVPVFGVIAQPFGEAEKESEGGGTNGCCGGWRSTVGDFRHKALYGGTLLGGVFHLGGTELERSKVYRARTKPDGTDPLPPTPTKEELKQRRAIISKSKAGGVVANCIASLSSRDLLHPEPLFITGAGYKTLALILGQREETLWFFPKPGTSLWDVAAADALLRATGGKLTDSLNRDLDYSKSRVEGSNEDGIVACCDAELHATCMELYAVEEWKDE